MVVRLLYSNACRYNSHAEPAHSVSLSHTHKVPPSHISPTVAYNCSVR